LEIESTNCFFVSDNLSYGKYMGFI